MTDNEIKTNCICRPYNLESFPVNIIDYIKKHEKLTIFHNTNSFLLKMELFFDEKDMNPHLSYKFSKIFRKNENDYINAGKFQLNNENLVMTFNSLKENICLLRPVIEKIYKKCLNHFMFVDGVLQVNEEGDIIIPKLLYNLNLFSFDFVSEVFDKGKTVLGMSESKEIELYFHGEYKENSYTITLNSEKTEPIKISSNLSFPYGDKKAMIFTRHEIITEALELLLLKFHKEYFHDNFFTIPELKTEEFREIEFNLFEIMTKNYIKHEENDELKKFDKKWRSIYNG